MGLAITGAAIRLAWLRCGAITEGGRLRHRAVVGVAITGGLRLSVAWLGCGAITWARR